jgi:phosphatidylglycerophosphatase A
VHRPDNAGAPELTPLDRVAFVVGTWFGCGQSPKAPGTVGSLGALPLHFLLIRLPLAYHVGAIVLVTVLGTWAAQRISDALGQEDPQRVVVDEVAGVLIAMGCVRLSPWWMAAVGFALFRFFDITKVGPIRAAEHARPAGVGIMADDLVAGVFAGILARLGAMALGV